jgi:uncharacterized protein YkwD
MMFVAATRMRSFALGSIAAITVVAFAAVASSPASGETLNPELQFASRINEARIAAGLPALVVKAKLADQARGWSIKMSEASGENLGRACQLSHNPQLAREVPLVWKTLGENVGCGAGNVDAVHQAFMDSPEHRRNILDPKFDSVGVAIATSDTTMFVTEVFMQSGNPRANKPKATRKIKRLAISRQRSRPSR